MHWENKLFQSITIQNCGVWFLHCFLSSEGRALAHRRVNCCVLVCRTVIVVGMAAWCSITLGPLGKEVTRGHTASCEVFVLLPHTALPLNFLQVVLYCSHIYYNTIFFSKQKYPSKRESIILCTYGFQIVSEILHVFWVLCVLHLG